MIILKNLNWYNENKTMEVEMKLLFLKVGVFSMFSLLILVSDTPFYMKVIFISAMLFFLLPFGNHFFSKEQMSRKVFSAVTCVAVFTLLLTLVPALMFKEISNSTNFFDFGLSIIVVGFYAILGFFIYGIPVSLLSDWISGHFSKRLLVAGLVHLTFGMLLIKELSIVPAICAASFWLIDEILQRKRFRTVLNNEGTH